MNIRTTLSRFGFSEALSTKRLFIAAALIAAAVVMRLARVTFFPELPNVEPITLVAVLAGALLGGTWGIVVPLAVVAVSDMFIGNDPILLFTWSAWLLIGSAAALLHPDRKASARFGSQMTLLGLGSTLFFYLYTNFGVWAVSGMYPHTASGLLDAYVMALPFLRNQLIGNAVLLPVGVTLALFAWNLYTVRTRSLVTNSVHE